MLESYVIICFRQRHFYLRHFILAFGFFFCFLHSLAAIIVCQKKIHPRKWVSLLCFGFLLQYSKWIDVFFIIKCLFQFVIRLEAYKLKLIYEIFHYNLYFVRLKFELISKKWTFTRFQWTHVHILISRAMRYLHFNIRRLFLGNFLSNLFESTFVPRQLLAEKKCQAYEMKPHYSLVVRNHIILWYLWNIFPWWCIWSERRSSVHAINQKNVFSHFVIHFLCDRPFACFIFFRCFFFHWTISLWTIVPAPQKDAENALRQMLNTISS